MNIKEDSIDEKLTEYITTHKEFKKLNLLFKKKGFGSYIFGTKSVTVKVDNNRLMGNFFLSFFLILVKSAQNYTSIDKFVQGTMDHEYDKLILESKF